jgi:N-sulfoglucosamine sulfohydrolase
MQSTSSNVQRLHQSCFSREYLEGRGGVRIRCGMGSLLVVIVMCSTAFAAERPNILFIIADDASRDSMGVYGSTYVKTPNFDRIANEGVMFTQAYNCNPKCAPARACLLTGRYSWQLEEACNHNPFLSDKWVFYPYLLEDSGYFMGFTGKGWGPGIHKGTDAGKSGFKKDNPAGHAYNNKTAKPPFKGISNVDYAANFEVFLDATPEDKPFCFWFGTKEPHRGYGKDNWRLDGRDLSDVTVPKYYPDNEVIRGDLADYAIEVEWYDTHIGRALKHLQDRGQLDNTLIIATSDHGMPFPRVKGQIYDDGFHIPLVARWGDRIKPGRVVTDFITFPDLAPTVMELAGLPLHEQMTGSSFVKQLLADGSGRIDPDRNHTLLGKERHDIGRTDGDLLSVAYPARAIRNDNFLYVRNFEPQRWPIGNPEFGYMNCDGSPTKTFLTELSQSDPDYHFFELAFGKRSAEELYDMTSDPDCVKNLAADPKYTDTKARLWTQLTEELTAQGDPRILGNGQIFDFYPNCRIDRQQKLYRKPAYDPVQLFEDKFGSE